MSLTGIIVRTPDAYYVESSYPEYSEPIMRTLRWKVTGARPANGNYGPAPQLEDNIGAEVTHSPGRGFLLYRNGAYTLLETEENASVSTAPIPCPKVRAGIATRYYSGRWQKCSKRDGWVSA